MMVSSSLDSSSEEEGEMVNAQILKQLQVMNKRLEEVEQQVASGKSTQHKKSKDMLKLSKTSCCNCDKSKGLCCSGNISATSFDESDIPDITYLRSSKSVKKQVDQKLSQLERDSHLQGNCSSQKIKSKGGGVEVLVEKKVAWPHDVILRGTTKQRVTYDQLSLPQFVQGFVKIFWLRVTAR